MVRITGCTRQRCCCPCSCRQSMLWIATMHALAADAETPRRARWELLAVHQHPGLRFSQLTLLDPGHAARHGAAVAAEPAAAVCLLQHISAAPKRNRSMAQAWVGGANMTLQHPPWLEVRPPAGLRPALCWHRPPTWPSVSSRARARAAQGATQCISSRCWTATLAQDGTLVIRHQGQVRCEALAGACRLHSAWWLRHLQP